MRRLIHMLMFFIILVLTALPALAQDAVETAPTYNGLGLLMILVGLAAAAGVGVMMARREASAEDDDLV